MSNILNKLVYSIKDLKELTNISKDTWLNLVNLGYLKPLEIGNKFLFMPEDVNKFLKWSKGRKLKNKQDLINELKNWR